MSLPPSLVQHVEQHACFTGCYGGDSDVNVCLNPTQALQPVVVVTCLDCLGKIGVPRSLLPAGLTTNYVLSQHLSDLMRQKRGFKMARSGYHTAGPGFWLSFAYYDCGLFLISASRSQQLGSDLDVLQMGMQHKVVQVLDPRMRDLQQFRAETIYVNFATFNDKITSKQQLLSSPQVRAAPQPGWQKVTLAEFLPLTTPIPKPPPKTLKVGDICPVCKAEYKSRSLFNGSYIGCLC